MRAPRFAGPAGITGSKKLRIIAGATEWAFDWFDLNNHPSLRLLTQGYRMWCFRCGECVHLNHAHNMASHAKSLKHAAAVAKDTRVDLTEEKLNALFVGIGDTTKFDTLYKQCHNRVVAFLPVAPDDTTRNY